MKVVIVHDWLIGGGAEKVVEQLHIMYPEAPIYTSCATKEWQQRLHGKVITGYLQKWPFFKLRKFLPVLRARWFYKLNLSAYDLIISSSGAEAKFVRARQGAKHVAYIHAPTHYYWDRYDEYIRNPGLGPLNWLARIGLKILVRRMRIKDHAAAQRPQVIVANSNFTKDKIQQYYGRSSVVVHPPVDIERFNLVNGSVLRQGFVTAGRQTAYKRFDLAIKACSDYGLSLTVVGQGPEHNKLTKIAGKTVSFITEANDQQLAEQFAKAEAFLFPGLDDFGITPVEAMATGTPVIAFWGGGALDYVLPGKTGEFFDQPASESLAEKLKNFNSAKYSTDEIMSKSKEFSPGNFQRNMGRVIRTETL